MENSFDTVCVNITNGAIKVKLLSGTNKRFSKRLMWTHKDVVYIWHVAYLQIGPYLDGRFLILANDF